MNSTHIRWHIKAPRENVYRALLDAEALVRWKVPDGMTCHVHTFDPREGGTFRISLTYNEPTWAGKTAAHTDTYPRPLRQTCGERAGRRSGRV
jgi:uncharacterized protein YndB with AHSA1/START domain